MPHLLGIDIGTSGTKAVICDDAGRTVASASAEHPIYSPKPGWSEQDPDDWWASACMATKSVLKRAALAGGDIAAIGLSGQMHGSVFLGANRKPLRRAILWNDQRTADQCAQIEAKVGGRAKLIELVANPALTGFTAPKIIWLREHEAKRYAKTRQILLPKDYIRFRMTGDFATDVSDASGTLLLDVAKRSWSKRMLEVLDIDADLMPKLYESPEVTGTLHADGARAMGLRAGTPVVGGAGDNAAGAVGSGVVMPGIVSATIGTSGVIFAHAEQPTLDPRGRVHTMCHAVPGQWCVFGCMLSAGGSLQWFRNTLAADVVALAKRRKVDPYELLIDEARTAPPGAEGLYFLPYLTGERCPHADPFARGAWIGLSARTHRGMMIRAILEGVTFGMRDALEILRGMNVGVREVRTTGGGARSAFWRQLQADIFNADVALTSAVEGPAYGVALLAGVGIGVWNSVEQACAAGVKRSERIRPNRKSAEQYEGIYAGYRQLYPAMKGFFGETYAR